MCNSFGVKCSYCFSKKTMTNQLFDEMSIYWQLLIQLPNVYFLCLMNNKIISENRNIIQQ